MESAAVPVDQPPAADPTAPGAKGLKPNAIGYVSNLVIAIASTPPAYSLAATLVSVGYRYFNLADPDAGTTFAWVTHTFGPQLGWINGWAIFLADIIVMASLAVIASTYTYLLFSWHSAANSNVAIIIGAVVCFGALLLLLRFWRPPGNAGVRRGTARPV